MLGESFSGEWRPFTVECGKDRLYVGGVRVFIRDVQMVFVKSGPIREELCSNLEAYDGALNVTRAWWTEACVQHGQRVFAGHEFGAEKKLLNSFVVLRGERSRKEKVSVEKVVLMYP